MNIALKKSKGFTLVEIMIAASILAGLILVVSSSFSFIRRTFTSVEVSSASASDIERFLISLYSELTYARTLSAPLSGASSPDVRFVSSEGEQISYSFVKETGKLTRTNHRNNTTRNVLEGMDEVTFSQFKPGLIQIFVDCESVSIITAVNVWNLP